MALSTLVQLAEQGQAPWLDFIRRGFTQDGSLARLVAEDGLKGVTSNPAIFEKAMGTGTDYDADFKQLAADGQRDAAEIYETLAVADIQQVAEILHPVYQKTNGVDGYVSLEVSPYLARDGAASIAEARRLWAWVNRPNVMIKVPGTPECVPAIRTLIEEGININVTLLFSIDAYKSVAEAFVAGLEARLARGLPIAKIASVASFFVSRIDAQIDKKIDARIAANDPESEALSALRGRVAIANAKLAYLWYQDFVAAARWQKLAQAGALPQRLLWASTGTKDKAYSDVLYVEELIGQNTVNTIPPATMDAFRDHGKIRPSLTENIDAARHVLAEADRLGLDLPGITLALVEDGVRLFAEAADALLLAVAKKRSAMLGNNLATLKYTLPEALQNSVANTLQTWQQKGHMRSLWARDAKLWTNGPEAKWLGWLDIVDERLAHIEELRQFQRDVQEQAFHHVLLLGMGGSSLGPEVFGAVFGQRQGWPKLHVLDSTDPQQIAAFEKAVDLPKTLVIVASKSGGTLEPNILKAYFWDKMQKAVGAEKAGHHFVAITDPGSHMQKLAEQDGFWRIFYGNPEIGGRYSVLSNFGLIPAASIGIEIEAFLNTTRIMVQSCTAGTPAEANQAAILGIILGEAQKAGHDKVTIIADPAIADFGAWLEQLIAESTGKRGTGLVPIDGEQVEDPAAYGNDRLFVFVHLADVLDTKRNNAVQKLEKAGQPVIRIGLNGHQEIGQQFFLWECATAVAGSVIGIDPFDQPDVEASKIKTRELTEAFSKTGALPAETPFAEFEGIKLFAHAAVKASSLTETLHNFFPQVKPGDYVGLLAYIARNPGHITQLQQIRSAISAKLHVATAAEFGPRFLHSTGQAYKGGPNSGVFLQITADDAADLAVPGETYRFSTVKAAQARGDFDVLVERGRRALRVHLPAHTTQALEKLHESIVAALT